MRVFHHHFKTITMKKIIVSFAIIAFGGFAMAQEQTPSVSTKEAVQPRSEYFENEIKILKTELSLSDDQVVKLRAANDKRREEMAALRQARKEQNAEQMKKMQATKRERDADVKEILSAEQYDKFQQYQERKRKEKLSKLKGKKSFKETIKPQLEAETK